MVLPMGLTTAWLLNLASAAGRVADGATHARPALNAALPVQPKMRRREGRRLP